MSIPKTPKLPISVLVVIYTTELDVLVIERADRAGYWQSVTGSLDALDEMPAHAAVREVFEETGLRIDAAKLEDWQHSITYEIFPHWRHRYAEGVTQNVEHWFSIQVAREVAIQLAPNEHTAYRWLPYQQAAALCFSPSNREAILRLPQRLAVKAKKAL